MRFGPSASVHHRLARAAVVLALAAGLSVAGGAARAAVARAGVARTAAAPASTPAGTSATTATTATTAGSTGAGTTSGSGAGQGITRTERAILLVTLTFLVGGGLLGAGGGDTEAPADPRPSITLHDDPNLVRTVTGTRSDRGRAPPLR